MNLFTTTQQSTHNQRFLKWIAQMIQAYTPDGFHPQMIQPYWLDDGSQKLYLRLLGSVSAMLMALILLPTALWLLTWITEALVLIPLAFISLRPLLKLGGIIVLSLSGRLETTWYMLPKYLRQFCHIFIMVVISWCVIGCLNIFFGNRSIAAILIWLIAVIKGFEILDNIDMDALYLSSLKPVRICQHITLRILLWRNGDLPLRLRYFINIMQRQQILTSKNNYIRFKNTIWMQQLADQNEIDNIIDHLKNPNFYSHAQAVLKNVSETAVLPLINALANHSKPLVRASVAKILGDIKDDRATLPLIRGLYDKDELVVKNVMNALVALGQSAVPDLADTLKEADIFVKIEVALILAVIKDNRAVEALSIALHDPADSVRSHAAYALGVIGDARVAADLIIALNDPSKEVQAAAAQALGRLKVLQAVPALKMLFASTSSDTRGFKDLNYVLLSALRSLEYNEA